MNTKSKIWIDKYIFGIAAWTINLFVIPLGKILNINHDLNNSFETIAICKYKGMGSIIQATPLIKTLRNKYPTAKIVFISSKENEEFLNLIEEVDEIILIDDNSPTKLILSILPFIKKLINTKIEVYIDLEVYSNFSTLISILSLSKNRFGFYLNSKHYRLGNYTHMMYYNNRSAISQTYLQFARLLNIDNIIHSFSNLDAKNSISFLENGKFAVKEEDYILINPNASDLRIERRWPAEKYISLINKIILQFPQYKIILIGSKGEKEYVNNILKNIDNSINVKSFAGLTNIPELISIIKHAKLFITNDSGPMHIGFSTNTKVLALFGPVSPNQYGQVKNCKIIYNNLYCSPCVHEFLVPPCNGQNKCMTSISTNSIFEAVKEIITTDKLSNNPTTNKILFKVNDFTMGTIYRKK